MMNLYGLCPGQSILILGSGDVGMIMARQFRQSGCRVIALVEQQGSLGGLPRNRRDCVEALGLPVLLNSTVEELRGEERIDSVVVRNLVSGERRVIPCDTLITALGLIPDHSLLEGRPCPPWLHFCGNCERVYDIVDNVTRSAERLAAELTMI